MEALDDNSGLLSGRNNLLTVLPSEHRLPRYEPRSLVIHGVDTLVDVVPSEICTLLPDAREPTVAMGSGKCFPVTARINKLGSIIVLGTVNVGRSAYRAIVYDTIARIE